MNVSATARGQESRSRRRGRGILAALLAFGLVGVLAAPTGAGPARAGETHAVSVNELGESGNAGSYTPVISPDGRYVAFQSFATNLTGEDLGERLTLRDGFLYDRETGSIRRIAVPEGGGRPSTHVWIGEFSADSRYLTFETSATGLVPGDDNSTMDVFLLDLQTWEVELVSVGSEGQQGNDASFASRMTADNRYLLFTSYATNFSDDHPEGEDVLQVYLRDLQEGTTQLISRNAEGEPADRGGAAYGDISADGRFVAFQSSAWNLDQVDVREDDLLHIFLLDRDTGEVRLINRGLKDPLVANHSFDPRISADGSLVTFTSGAAFAPGDQNFQWDVYGYDRETQRLERISIGNAGQEGNWNAQNAKPSGNGRYVVFEGQHGLHDGDTELGLMAYLHDRVTGVTEPLAIGADGALGERNSTDPWISPDGRLVAFSTGSALVPGLSDGVNVFLRDRGPELGVGQLSAVTTEDEVRASGWATFTGTVVSEASGSQPTGDAGLALERVRVVHRPEEKELLIRLDLPWVLPSINTWGTGRTPANRTGAGLPSTVYGLSFEVGGVTYEARIARSIEAGLHPEAKLFRCDPVCTQGSELAGSIGAAGNEVRLVVPLSALDAGDEVELTSMTAFVGPGDGRVGALPAHTLELPDAVIAAPTVELALTLRGAASGEVDNWSAAALENGSFTGSLPISSLSDGDYDVWAQTCLGETCTTTSRPVTLDRGDVSVPVATILQLDVEGTGSNRVLRARLSLADSPETPVAGRTIDFYGDGQLIGSAATDEDGVASLEAPPRYRGGKHAFEASFDGDDSYLGSTAAAQT